MTATSTDRFTKTREGAILALGVAATTKIPAGVMVQVNATGYAVNGAATIANRTLGVSSEAADNAAGSNGDISVPVLTGIAARFGNSASTDEITRADIGKDCFVVDNQTVAKTSNGGVRPRAGKIIDVDSAGVWVFFEAPGVSNPVGAAVGGLRVVFGQATTASASDTVDTGLSKVAMAVANLEDAPVVGCDRAQAVIGDQAGAPAAGSILIKTFKPTATNDATPVAATTTGKKVNWIAVGYP